MCLWSIVYILVFISHRAKNKTGCVCYGLIWKECLEINIKPEIVLRDPLWNKTWIVGKTWKALLNDDGERTLNKDFGAEGIKNHMQLKSLFFVIFGGTCLERGSKLLPETEWALRIVAGHSRLTQQHVIYYFV